MLYSFSAHWWTNGDQKGYLRDVRYLVQSWPFRSKNVSNVFLEGCDFYIKVTVSFLTRFCEAIFITNTLKLSTTSLWHTSNRIFMLTKSVTNVLILSSTNSAIDIGQQYYLVLGFNGQWEKGECSCEFKLFKPIFRLC